MEKEKSKGLGDTIAKITEVTGIKKVVKAVSEAVDKDCGCEKRQSTLNRLFPYKK
jgi:glycerol dehydrogenase-like iron-containing ADH family enzyme